MPNDLNPFARLAYREGQLLTAHDLRAEKFYEDRLRWLHVMGLHATWGIMSGLTVSGNSGDQTLTVAPGYAIDNEGRDLLLAGEMKLPLPAVLTPTTLVLVVSYQPDAKFRSYAQLTQVCLHESQSRPLEQLEFSWQQPTDVCFGRQIPLAMVEVSGGALQGQPDERVRRYARRATTPLIGWGSTEAGQTGWTIKDQDQPKVESLWLEVMVDTSAAGFTQTPDYFALLCGYGVNNPERLKTDQAIQEALASVEATVFLSHLSFIRYQTPLGFYYHVLRQSDKLPGVPGVHVNDAQAEQLRWRIYWIGVEPNSDCPLEVPFLLPFFGAAFS
jgi:hypothetical protein